MSMFTPGPWRVQGRYSEEERGLAVIAVHEDVPIDGTPTRGMVAWSSQLLPEFASECEANAVLISAAPDMYEVLEDIISIDESGSSLPEYIKIRIFAVLAKARNQKTQGLEK